MEYQVRKCLLDAKREEQITAEVIVPTGEDASPFLAVFISNVTMVESTNNAFSLSTLVISDEEEDRLTENLPSQMVPSIIFTLPCLLITASGTSIVQI